MQSGSANITDITKIRTKEKMTSFEDFFKDSKRLAESTTLPILQTKLTAGITQITEGILFGSNATQAKQEKFSKEVANYATSDEVISSFSKNIGEPKTNETEEEFVERASHVLRAVLKKKFDV